MTTLLCWTVFNGYRGTPNAHPYTSGSYPHFSLDYCFNEPHWISRDEICNLNLWRLVIMLRIQNVKAQYLDIRNKESFTHNFLGFVNVEEQDTKRENFICCCGTGREKEVSICNKFLALTYGTGALSISLPLIDSSFKWALHRVQYTS